MMAHGIKYLLCLASLGQPAGCVPSWLLVRINPVLVEPRTLPKTERNMDDKLLNVFRKVAPPLLSDFAKGAMTIALISE